MANQTSTPDGYTPPASPSQSSLGYQLVTLRPILAAARTRAESLALVEHQRVQAAAARQLRTRAESLAQYLQVAQHSVASYQHPEAVSHQAPAPLQSGLVPTSTVDNRTSSLHTPRQPANAPAIHTSNTPLRTAARHRQPIPNVEPDKHSLQAPGAPAGVSHNRPPLPTGNSALSTNTAHGAPTIEAAHTTSPLTHNLNQTPLPPSPHPFFASSTPQTSPNPLNGPKYNLSHPQNILTLSLNQTDHVEKTPGQYTCYHACHHPCTHPCCREGMKGGWYEKLRTIKRRRKVIRVEREGVLRRYPELAVTEEDRWFVRGQNWRALQMQWLGMGNGGGDGVGTVGGVDGGGEGDGGEKVDDGDSKDTGDGRDNGNKVDTGDKTDAGNTKNTGNNIGTGEAE